MKLLQRHKTITYLSRYSYHYISQSCHCRRVLLSHPLPCLYPTSAGICHGIYACITPYHSPNLYLTCILRMSDTNLTGAVLYFFLPLPRSPRPATDGVDIVGNSVCLGVSDPAGDSVRSRHLPSRLTFVEALLRKLERGWSGKQPTPLRLCPAGKQLRSSERQLRSSNKQLRSSDQQLRSPDKQLRSTER